MRHLIIYKKDQSAFDRIRLEVILRDINGVSKITKDDLADYCGYTFKDDMTTLYISKNLSDISIHGTGNASLNLVLEIRKHYPESLKLTDNSYNFDFSLDEVDSIENLQKNINDEKIEIEQ